MQHITQRSHPSKSIVEALQEPVEKDVYSILKKHDSPIPAKQIRRELNNKYVIKEINVALYRKLLPQKIVAMVDGPCPTWKLAMDEEEADDEGKGADNEDDDGYGCKQKIVIIDLGNVHDCLQKCEDWVDAGVIAEVWAFADYNFNGYGINPPARSIKGVQVFKVEEASRNAADVMM